MTKQLGKCSHCRRPLIMDGKRCRFCGHKAKWRERRRGQATLTKRARRVLTKDLKRQQTQLYEIVEHGGDRVAVTQYAMTWQQAELLACEWMRHHGYRDATLTAAGADGGVDIQSRRAVAQVKHHLKPLGVAEMQRLSGIAISAEKQALFFAYKGFRCRPSLPVNGGGLLDHVGC